MEPRKKAKETDAIKEKLERYKAMPRRIDNLIERLEALNNSMGSPSTPNLTGLPSGGGDGTTKIEREVLRKLELEDRISKLVKDERELRHELETLIERMASPDEQTVIEMRYLDGARWWPICEALYSTEDDYEEKADKYLKRTFKLHGSALQSLARIYKSRQ